MEVKQVWIVAVNTKKYGRFLEGSGISGPQCLLLNFVEEKLDLVFANVITSLGKG